MTLAGGSRIFVDMAKRKKRKKSACRIGKVKSGPRKGRCKKTRGGKRKSKRSRSRRRSRRSGVHRRGRRKALKCNNVPSRDSGNKFAALFAKRGKTATVVQKSGGGYAVCHS